MSYSFESEQVAAKAMLLEVGTLMNKHTIDYAVIGGWVPFLFNSDPISHPGTFDVDIVLNTALSKDSVISALDFMVDESSYRRAPKNAFQIYKEIVVGNEPLIFHVDFLHRKYADDSDDLTRTWGRYESIGTVGTDVIFTQKEMRSKEVYGIGVTGEAVSANIVFASEAGFLCSKARSVGLGKRERDGYDVYLLLKQSEDYDTLKKRSASLLGDNVFFASMNRLQEQFTTGQPAPVKAANYLCGYSKEFTNQPELAEQEIIKVVQTFLNEIGIE